MNANLKLMKFTLLYLFSIVILIKNNILIYKKNIFNNYF